MNNEIKGHPMNKQQMELGFDGGASFQPVIRHVPRRGRARWWFEQMHRVVDAAFDWRPRPAARPEQVYLPLHPSSAGG